MCTEQDLVHFETIPPVNDELSLDPSNRAIQNRIVGGQEHFLLFDRHQFYSTIAFLRLCFREFPLLSFHLVGPFSDLPQHTSAAADGELKG